MLEVKPTGQHSCIVPPPGMAEMATIPSLALLQKHLLGGFTNDMPPLNCHWWESYCITPQYSTLLIHEM